MTTDDRVLDRILFEPTGEASQMERIPWPVGGAPIALPSHSAHGGGLPAADVIVMTFTSAEGKALADVLTPGVQSSGWVHYDKDFDAYESALTSRSPARGERRLGSWHLTRIAGKRVICFKSELHPATDGPSLPLAKLWAQLIADANPSLVITTGTAGGVGTGTQLGDVVIADWVQWDCLRQFAHEPWAIAKYAPTGPRTYHADLATLLAPNFAKLPVDLVTLTRPPTVWADLSGTITTDFFAMGDTTDAYGLLKLNQWCRTVEMDDAACGLAVAGLEHPPQWLSIRNASDPVMDGSLALAEQSKQASAIYERWGYTTSIGSAIACWAVITSIPTDQGAIAA